MSNISYVALSQATALTRSMDTTAHNLANATTSGYKAIHPVLESIPDGSGDNAINYVRESGTYLELADGPLMQTGNPMDIAVAGDGTNRLDDVDLLFSETLENHIEGRLLFNFFFSATASCGSNGNGSGGADSPALFHRLHQLSGLADGQGVQLAEDVFEILFEFHGGLGFFGHCFRGWLGWVEDGREGLGIGLPAVHPGRNRAGGRGGNLGEKSCELPGGAG